MTELVLMSYGSFYTNCYREHGLFLEYTLRNIITLY
jgi:hypothetical protein